MTCSSLRVAQDEAIDQGAIDRERLRRVWYLAAQRERLGIVEKLRGASLFDAAPPEYRYGLCAFPGCGLPRGTASLCSSHARQKTRRGLLLLTPLGAPSPLPRPPAAVTCAKGHNEWVPNSNGGRACRACRLERQRERRGKQGGRVGSADVRHDHHLLRNRAAARRPPRAVDGVSNLRLCAARLRLVVDEEST